MKVTTRELKEKLNKILQFQQRDDVSMALFKELTEKATKYKKIIDFLEDDDIDSYIKTEAGELDNEAMKKHMES